MDIFGKSKKRKFEDLSNQVEGNIDNISSLQTQVEENIDKISSLQTQVAQITSEVHTNALVAFDPNNTSSNITLYDSNTRVVKSNDTSYASSYSLETLDFTDADYKIKLTLTANSTGGALPIFGIVQQPVELKGISITGYATVERVSGWGDAFIVRIDNSNKVSINTYSGVYFSALPAVKTKGSTIEVTFRKIDNYIMLDDNIITSSGIQRISNIPMTRNHIAGNSPYYIFVGDGGDIQSSMGCTVSVTRMPRPPPTVVINEANEGIEGVVM